MPPRINNNRFHYTTPTRVCISIQPCLTQVNSRSGTKSAGSAKPRCRHFTIIQLSFPRRKPAHRRRTRTAFCDAPVPQDQGAAGSGAGPFALGQTIRTDAVHAPSVNPFSQAQFMHPLANHSPKRSSCALWQTIHPSAVHAPFGNPLTQTQFMRSLASYSRKRCSRALGQSILANAVHAPFSKPFTQTQFMRPLANH